MSIEIRLNDRNEFFCNLGEFANAEADPRRPMGLMLIEPQYVDALLRDGPKPGPLGGVHSAARYANTDAVYVNFECNGTTWRWQLFDAHWWDGVEQPVMIGKLTETIAYVHAPHDASRSFSGVTIRR